MEKEIEVRRKDREIKKGKCVHCLKIVDKLTWDHLFPRSWYPDITPRNLEKWKFPSCKKCNAAYGKIEEELLWKLGLCIDPKDAKSSGIAEKVLRSLDPQYAKTEKDRRVRQGKREKVKRGLVNFGKLPLHGILPNFGPKEHKPNSRYLGVLVPEEQLFALAKKLIRGLYYIIDNSYIEKTHKFDIFFVNDSDAHIAKDPIEKFGKYYDRGPGILIGLAETKDDSGSSLFLVEIWGKLKIYGTVGLIR